MSLEAVERWNLALGAVVLGVSFAVASPTFAVSVAVGTVLEAVNFRGLRRSAELLFNGPRPGSRGWSVGFGLRLVLLAVGIGAAMVAGANPVGLLVGLSLIVPAVFIEAWRARPPVVEGAPALPADDPAWDRWNPWLARERDEDEHEDWRES
ncbi:MAG: ATP synthase subunit I [Myxococcota bacterium]